MNDIKLTDRESEVLNSLVDEYIQTGKPVGSRSFVHKYSFNVSPATMRNIMYDLESAGYLMQPHISAGRIPLNKGYRYYLDSILDSYNFVYENPSIRNDVFKREIEYDKMFASIAKILSAVSNYIGIILTPRPDFMVVKHVELILLAAQDILVIFVTRTGIILNKRVSVSEYLNQDELHKFSKYLTAELNGHSLLSLKDKYFNDMRKKLNKIEQYQLAIDIVQLALSSNDEPDIYLEGIENVLHIPDIINEEILNEFLFLIENKKNVSQIIEKAIDVDGIYTLIGNEVSMNMNDTKINNFSFVTKSYKIGNKNVGALGIIGPTRMDYKKSIPIVDYIGNIVSELLTKMSQ